MFNITELNNLDLFTELLPLVHKVNTLDLQSYLPLYTYGNHTCKDISLFSICDCYLVKRFVLDHYNHIQYC